MLLRPTKMLAKRVHVALGEPMPDDAAKPYADWCAHEFMMGRLRHLMFTHTRSLLSAVAPARGVTTADALIRSFAECVRGQLHQLGYADIWQHHIEPELAAVHFAVIPNRSVLGSMNELIAMARSYPEKLPLDEVNRRLVGVPMFAINPCWPRKVFESLRP